MSLFHYAVSSKAVPRCYKTNQKACNRYIIIIIYNRLYVYYTLHTNNISVYISIAANTILYHRSVGCYKFPHYLLCVIKCRTNIVTHKPTRCVYQCLPTTIMLYFMNHLQIRWPSNKMWNTSDVGSCYWCYKALRVWLARML